MKNNAIFSYFFGSWEELKRVHWPTQKEVLNHTVIVLISSILAIVVTSGIDYGLTFVVQYLVENKK